MRITTVLLAVFFSSTLLAYEVCTTDNSYLEALIPQVQPSLGHSLPASCVEAAHLSLAPTGYYGFCAGESGTPSRSHPRPCVSEKYVNVVHDALVRVTDCLGYDTHMAFATFNLESALHVNAVGRSRDAGVGQLTKVAIEEVNLNAFERARRMVSKSSKESCQSLVPEMTAHPSHIDERCGFVSLPANPSRNIIYSILLLQQNHRVIGNLWARLGIALPSGIDETLLKNYLAKLAYNAGPGGLVSTLKAYLDQRGGSLMNQDFNFENFGSASYVSFLAEHFPSSDAAVRRRVSRYISYLLAAARRADSLAGGTLACLHPDYLASAALQSLPADFSPDSELSNRLVRENMSKLAQQMAQEQTQKSQLNCRRAKHDFLFAFRTQNANPEDLPYGLKQIYKGLCKE